MSIDYRGIKSDLDELIAIQHQSIQGATLLLARENEGRQSPVLSKLVQTLGKWSTTPPAVVLQEIEDIKRTCCVGADGANVSVTSESLVGMDEITKILGVKKNWLYQRTRLKGFPVVKVGKYNRFYPSEVIAYLQEKGGS